MKKSEIQSKIKTLFEFFEAGRIPTLAVHEQYPNLPKNSEALYNYFSLSILINFQRDSVRLWQAAIDTYDDPETRYLFSPDAVEEEYLEKVRKDMLRHKLALQPVKHIEIWTKLCKVISTEYEGSFLKLISSNNFDAELILSTLYTNRKKFPYLSGPKLSSYWLFILLRYTDLQLSNSNLISIIPDTHVAKASSKLGVTDSRDPNKIITAWFEILKGTNIMPYQMHSVLWNWSRNKFQPVV